MRPVFSRFQLTLSKTRHKTLYKLAAPIASSCWTCTAWNPCHLITVRFPGQARRYRQHPHRHTMEPRTRYNNQTQSLQRADGVLDRRTGNIQPK